MRKYIIHQSSEIFKWTLKQRSFQRRLLLMVLCLLVLTMITPLMASREPAVVYANRITATCRNAPSDAQTINAAIASSSAGDEIVIQGPCLINATIILLGDRTYSGYSRSGTVLTQAIGANLPAMLASDSYVNNSPSTGNPVTIQHLTLNGDKADNPTGTDGIILRSWLSTIEDVHITGMSGNGLRVTNLSANGTPLSNTEVNGRIVNNFIEACGKNGIYVEDTGNGVTDWLLSENRIASSGGDAIHMDNASGWMVERNHIYGVARNAVYANRLFGATISDNYIEDFGGTTITGTWYGINATIQGDFASTITSNRVFNNEKNNTSNYRYIAITNVNYGTGDASVTGNTIRGAGKSRSTGFYYTTGSGKGLRVTSTGNLVDAVQTIRSVGSGVTVTVGV